MKRPMMWVKKFFQLERAHRWLVVRSACALVAMWIGLRILSVRRLDVLAAGRGRALLATHRHSAERIAWALRAAARYVPGATCLPQALAAQFMLARHGHAARLRIGVARTEQGRVAGHAWVEGADGLVIGRVDTRYALLEDVAG